MVNDLICFISLLSFYFFTSFLQTVLLPGCSVLLQLPSKRVLMNSQQIYFFKGGSLVTHLFWSWSFVVSGLWVKINLQYILSKSDLLILNGNNQTWPRCTRLIFKQRLTKKLERAMNLAQRRKAVGLKRVARTQSDPSFRRGFNRGPNKKENGDCPVPEKTEMLLELERLVVPSWRILPVWVPLWTNRVSWPRFFRRSTKRPLFTVSW